MSEALYTLDDSLWFEWIELEDIDSTNNFLRNYRPIIPKEITLVTATHQTAGRGQQGNSWESETGKNLLFSLRVHPHMVDASQQFILSQAIALAICESLQLYTDNIRIKWLTIACFEMQFGNTTVVTDPCIGVSPNNDLTWENIDNCDIITLSHSHWDHITDLPAMLDKYPAPLLTGTLTAMPMLRWLDCNPSRIYPMDANLELDFGEVKIMSLFGRHCTLPFHSVTALEAHFKKNPIAPPASQCSICRFSALWSTETTCSLTKTAQSY